ncbi:PKD domain-containing protein [Pseudophaeobacter flagellatus]|uniref:PKD domain-containing protein n=1 Tax=Pseudophaeobacter flagellatus TaxID=2899119 RepID=UPI001E4EBA53|nr:PKD domain-containing protein [Pseudophaeobacter flagellatus]MCD9147779.1 PKD domain-containing protein [Pseudophaeobacter flagellatus]
MRMIFRLAVVTVLVLAGMFTNGAMSQETETKEGLLVVYGVLAPTREGDVDHREQIFVSVPADLRDRFYLRIFDPEVSGFGDFTYGGTGNALTTFRIFGGAGAYSAADRPAPEPDGARVPQQRRVEPITGPGTLLKDVSFGNDRSTDKSWVSLSALQAKQGEVIGQRAYFRLDIQGNGGDDGNGFSVAVSLARDRNKPVEGADMFAFRPTVRWWKGQPATQIWLQPDSTGPHQIQSFDAARGTLALTTDYVDVPVRVSGQDFWTSDQVPLEGDNLALSLVGGFETPNDVTLAVFDAEGNPVPLQMPPRRAPTPARPSAIATGRPLADCRSVAFDGDPSFGRRPLAYDWDFGDGTKSDAAVIAHRYDQEGHYTARLRVLEQGVRPGRGAEVKIPVHIRSAPIAKAGAEVVVAPGQMLDFDASGSQASDSPITRFHWTFGDGSQSNAAQTQKSYAAPGQYRVVLRVEDDSAHPCNFGLSTRLVIVNARPIAEAGRNQSAIVGQSVRFNGGASYDIDGGISAYQWDMGDGTRLSGETVDHVFEKEGKYDVALRVIDGSGVANDSRVDRMQVVVNAPPEPQFTIPERPISVAEVATLDASASTDGDGAILSYQWDFGDGVVAEGPRVNYAWSQPGVFPVTLTVLDDSGTASALQRLTRNVTVDAAPVADAGPDQYVTASEVRFDGRGSWDAEGQITSYDWDFGDGTTGQGATVDHAYLRPGVFEVALLVRDDSGAPLNRHRDTMTVTINASPIADAGPPQTVAPGEEFVLSAHASVDPDGDISQYVWAFPDGRQARGLRVAQSISEPGLHRIGLTVHDNFQGGAASDESEALITVNRAPVAVAGADMLIAPDDTVIFDASQSFDADGRIQGFRWEFDDLGAPLEAPVVERAYVNPGVWSAQLFVTDDSGVANSTATDSLTIRVNSQPVAEAGPAIISDDLHVRLSAVGSADSDGDALIYRWDFGDGSAPAVGLEVLHVFPGAGVYPITLQVDDGTGLSNARAIDATSVTITARPVANAGGNRDVCSGEPILFDASDSLDPDGGLLRYSWDFGDGSRSELINPTKTYEQPGVYPVTLTVNNETGSDRGSSLDRIAAIVRKGPIADAGPDRTVCTNSKVRFDGAGSSDADGAVNAYAWTFGEGGTASGESPEYLFDTAGDYTVTLTITGEALGRCSPLDIDTAAVTVIEAPGLQVLGPDRVAAVVEAGFRAGLSRLGQSVPERFQWDFGDGSQGSGEEVTHSYAKPGTYLVTLSAELSGGSAECGTLEARRKVTVNAAPQPVITGPSVVAVGQAVVFEADKSSDSDGAVTAFDWDFGDGQSASGVLAAHSFAEPGRYTVTLSATDDAAVANSRATTTQEVTVNRPPLAGLSRRGIVCPKVDLDWTVAADAGTQVAWDLGDGTTAKGNSLSHPFAQPGLYPVVVTLDDGRGLANSRNSEATYVRVNAAPSALAGPDRLVCAQDTVVFDAGASGDLDGSLTKWIWEFADGVVLEGARVERSFPAAMDTSVRLTVTDDSGAPACATGTDSARILVNAPPQVDAGPDRQVMVGASHDVVRFDASASKDPDGQGVHLNWMFGDGSEASGAIVRHRYSAPGTYKVQVVARDTSGLICGTATDTATITAIARE